MLDLAVCDDNITELENLGNLLMDYRTIHPDVDLRVRRFQSAYDLVDCLESGRTFQMYLLDAHLPWLDGLNVAAAVHLLDEKAPIVCILSSPEVLYTGPACSALLYKPLSPSNLYSVLERLWADLEWKQSQELSLRTPEGRREIPYSQISFLRYREHVVSCHLADGEVIQSVTLREPFSQITQPLLRDKNFVRVSSACVVNLSFAEKMDGQELVMRNGDRLPIPRSNEVQLRRTLRDFLGHRS